MAERLSSRDNSTNVQGLDCYLGKKYQDGSSCSPPRGRTNTKLDPSVPRDASGPWPDIPTAHQEKCSENCSHQHPDWVLTPHHWEIMRHPAPSPGKHDYKCPDVLCAGVGRSSTRSRVPVHPLDKSIQQCHVKSIRLFNSGVTDSPCLSWEKLSPQTYWLGKGLMLPRHCPTLPIPTHSALFNWRSQQPGQNIQLTKSATRAETLNKWQEWSQNSGWTRTLLPEI